jgi:hypothetical protein
LRPVAPISATLFEMATAAPKLSPAIIALSAALVIVLAYEY